MTDRVKDFTRERRRVKQLPSNSPAGGTTPPRAFTQFSLPGPAGGALAVTRPPRHRRTSLWSPSPSLVVAMPPSAAEECRAPAHPSGRPLAEERVGS